jgi:hypothetical protein
MINQRASPLIETGSPSNARFHHKLVSTMSDVNVVTWAASAFPAGLVGQMVAMEIATNVHIEH